MHDSLCPFRFLAMVAVLFSQTEPFSNFDKGSQEEYFCEIILKSGHRLKRCGLKVFLFLALTAILFRRVVPF